MEKFFLNVHKKMFLNIWTELVKQLLIHVLFNKRTVPLGGHSSKHSYFINGKHSMDNFNTTDLHRLSWLGNLFMHEKTTVRSHSNK